jgi:hypothetical protein
MTLLILCAAVACAPRAEGQYAREGGPLEGRYIMTSETPVDPPPGEKIDRIGIEISGNAARTIFDAMAVETKEEPCGSGVLKKAGHLECSKVLNESGQPNGEYYCHVGVLLDTGQSASAFAC